MSKLNNYIITFHTHLSALKTNRSFQKSGIKSTISPVPRKLSSSCGSCLIFEDIDSHLDLLDEDADKMYIVDNEDYTLIWRGEE